MRPLLWLAAILLVTGCARRELNISSDPTGAIVYINGDELGRTPMKYDFKFYGDYDIVLRKDGYETLKTSRKLSTPLSGVPPFDLFGELFGSKDVREWTFTMAPEDPAAQDATAMLARSAEMKSQLQSSKFTRAPSTAPTTAPAVQSPMRSVLP